MGKRRIIIYHSKSGNEPVVELILALRRVESKSNTVLLNKINDYIEALSEYGIEKLAPQYVKHIQGPIWELRPKRIRILFGVLGTGEYVLLHPFVKKTVKTPKREIDKAIRELQEYQEESREE